MMQPRICERCGNEFIPVRGVQKRCGSLTQKMGCSYLYQLEYHHKWHKENKDSVSQQKKQYYADNPEAKQRKMFRDRINRYGLSESEYNDLIDSQASLCAICQEPVSYYGAHIDHCHSTNRVRGLLCGKCNRGLGMFNDNTELLNKAKEYLEDK